MDPSTYEEGIHGFYDGVEVVFSTDHADNTFGVIVGGILILVAFLGIVLGISYLVIRTKEKRRRQEPARIQREEGEELLDFPRSTHILDTDAQHYA